MGRVLVMGTSIRPGLSDVCAMVLVVVGLAGCSGGLRSRTARDAAVITMEPVKVTAQRSEDGAAGVVVEAYDARDLLQRGNEALAAGRLSEARGTYERLVVDFPDSALASAAHYNAALSYERAGEHEAAARRYLKLVAELPDSEDVKDSFFQAARNYESISRWEQVVSVLEGVLQREDLTPDERIEAMTRRGVAMVQARRFGEAEAELRRALSYHRREGLNEIRTDYYLAQAQHALGEIPRLLMESVEMTSEEAQFREALERRCDLLLRAQTQYVQAIRVGNAHWGAASAYRIGEMYSRLYDDVMAIPMGDIEVPPDLRTEEEIRLFLEEYPRVYRRLLRERLEPLLHNAIRWWESNLMMVERTGAQGEWAERTRANLSRVQELLEAIGEEEDAGDGEGGDGDPSSSDTALD